MTLTLGTAQFGMSYGVSNREGRVSEKQFQMICAKFRESGFNNYDTARAYGNSEQRLAKILNSNDSITTKIPPNVNQIQPEEWFEKNFFTSLEILNVTKVDTLVFHRSEDLLSTPHIYLERKIKEYKESKKIKHFGVSVYKKEELDTVLRYFKIDFVQFPVSLIDRTFLNDNYLLTLKDKGIIIEARSVFLQGLLLMESRLLPPYFDAWRQHFQEFETWLQTYNGLSKLEACISFIKSIPEIDRVVIGVQNIAELEQVLYAMNISKVYSYPIIASRDDKLINPSRWEFPA